MYSQKNPERSNLNDPKLTTILFAILVKKVGGSITITQADIDDIAYQQLVERGNEDGTLDFILIERKKSS